MRSFGVWVLHKARRRFMCKAVSSDCASPTAPRRDRSRDFKKALGVRVEELC